MKLNPDILAGSHSLVSVMLLCLAEAPVLKQLYDLWRVNTCINKQNNSASRHYEFINTILTNPDNRLFFSSMETFWMHPFNESPAPRYSALLPPLSPSVSPHIRVWIKKHLNSRVYRRHQAKTHLQWLNTRDAKLTATCLAKYFKMQDSLLSTTILLLHFLQTLFSSVLHTQKGGRVSCRTLTRNSMPDR